MPGERIWSTYRDGDWSAPFDDPASPWYHATLTADLVGYVPHGGGGQADQDNPAAGDTVIISHAVTVDVDSSAGNSMQGQIWAPLAFAATGGSAVTRLATGLYRASGAILGPHGIGGRGLSETEPVLITNGVSRPRVTFPAPPPSGCTYTVYLTAASGASGTGRSYCGSITGAYVDLVGDKGGNTYAGGVADGGVYVLGTQSSPPADRNATAVTLADGGSLVIAPGKALTLRGDILIEAAGADWITVGAGGSFGFDATLAIAPSQAEYRVQFPGAWKLVSQ